MYKDVMCVMCVKRERNVYTNMSNLMIIIVIPHNNYKGNSNHYHHIDNI